MCAVVTRWAGSRGVRALLIAVLAARGCTRACAPVHPPGRLSPPPPARLPQAPATRKGTHARAPVHPPGQPDQPPVPRSPQPPPQRQDRGERGRLLADQPDELQPGPRRLALDLLAGELQVVDARRAHRQVAGEAQLLVALRQLLLA